MTHRQFEVWQLWLKAEWNQPSRTDHYLMRLAQAFGGSEDSTLDDFKIPFAWPNPEDRVDLQEKQVAVSKSMSLFKGPNRGG